MPLTEKQKAIRDANKRLKGARTLVLMVAVAYVDGQVQESKLRGAVAEYREAVSRYEALVPTTE